MRIKTIEEVKLENYDKKANKVLQIILLVLFIAFTGLEIKAILTPKIVYINNVGVASTQVEEKAATPAVISTNGVENSRLVGDIDKLVCDTFGDDCKIALAVMKAESQGDCSRVGDKHIMFEKNGVNYGASYGCFQIRHLEGRPDPEKLLDAKFNINYAHPAGRGRILCGEAIFRLLKSNR